MAHPLRRCGLWVFSCCCATCAGVVPPTVPLRSFACFVFWGVAQLYLFIWIYYYYYAGVRACAYAYACVCMYVGSVSRIACATCASEGFGLPCVAGLGLGRHGRVAQWWHSLARLCCAVPGLCRLDRLFATVRCCIVKVAHFCLCAFSGGAGPVN